MDDEFKLCWKNFQDNIASGFQNLYDRGDLVDVTLACDGKLLHAHKIVLAICSPYFQEIFITNPCKHPIIILKDVTFNIMCELLEFMYQGVVNVKHTELQSFMKIGQLLQIKGLATNATSSAASTSSSEKSCSQTPQIADDVTNAACSDTAANASNNNKNSSNDGQNTENSNSGKPINTSNTSTARIHSPAASPIRMDFVSSLTPQNFKISSDNHPFHGGAGSKRHLEFTSDSLSNYSKKQIRRSVAAAHAANDHGGDHNDDTGMEQVNPEEFFLPSIPHISMVESRYDLNNIKREGDHHSLGSSSASLRNSFGPAFNFDYNLYKNSGGSSSSGGGGSLEYPNELHMPNDYSKNFGNHMDIPPIAPGEHWFQGKLEFMLSQRGKPLLVHDGHTFGIQYVRKDKKYWQCNLSRKFNCKARVTTTDTGEIIVTNNEHCHTEIRQHLRKDYQRNKVMMNALINLSTNRLAESFRRHPHVNSLGSLSNFSSMISSSHPGTPLSTHMDVADHGNLLDLGKNPNDILHSPHPHHLQQQQRQQQHQQSIHDIHDDDDDINDVPLDCGIRSTSTLIENALKKPNNSSNNNNNNNDNNPNNICSKDGDD